MSLVPSLLQAIVTTDGEALVLHVGEKPYVVTPTGQVDLATRGLTFDAVEFPFAFLQAFGNKETTLRRLRAGDTNKSDFAGRLVPAIDKIRRRPALIAMYT